MFILETFIDPLSGNLSHAWSHILSGFFICCNVNYGVSTPLLSSMINNNGLVFVRHNSQAPIHIIYYGIIDLDILDIWCTGSGTKFTFKPLSNPHLISVIIVITHVKSFNQVKWSVSVKLATIIRTGMLNTKKNIFHMIGKRFRGFFVAVLSLVPSALT